jgi:hypothetical protein
MVRRFGPLLAALVLCALAPGSARATVAIVDAQTSVPTGPFRFGEEVTADLEILVNTTVIRPEDLHAATRFDPYTVLAPPERQTRADGHITSVRFRYLLQCASLACTMGPGKEQRQITFPAAVVSYVRDDGKTRTRKVAWQPIVLVTRVHDPLSRPATATQARQQLPGDPVLRLPLSVKSPPPSYRVRPEILAIVLFAAALFALGGAGVVGRPLLVLVRRGAPVAPPLSPLEQAVAAVESAGQREPGSAEHREALALLSRQLRRVNANELVTRARKLAWSEDAPTAAASRSLTSEVRAGMDEER